jgi:hypothetical protein
MDPEEFEDSLGRLSYKRSLSLMPRGHGDAVLQHAHGHGHGELILIIIILIIYNVDVHVAV